MIRFSNTVLIEQLEKAFEIEAALRKKICMLEERDKNTEGDKIACAKNNNDKLKCIIYLEAEILKRLMRESQTNKELLSEEYKDANERLRDLDMQCIDCIKELKEEADYSKEETTMKEQE